MDKDDKMQDEEYYSQPKQVFRIPWNTPGPDAEKFCTPGYYRQNQMQEAANKITGSFQVSYDMKRKIGDKGNVGGKYFCFFSSPEEFFTYTADEKIRNFYEIISSACCLYFDIDHYTENEHDDDKLELIVNTIIQQLLIRWPQLAAGPQGDPLKKIIVTKSSRWKANVFKHSFHIVFPCIGFTKNTGEIKAFANQLATMHILIGKDAHMREASMIDTAVYTKNRLLRMIGSWKWGDSEKDALEFHPYSQHTMETLLETLASNTRAVTHWIPESGNVAEKGKKGIKRTRVGVPRDKSDCSSTESSQGVDARMTLPLNVISDLQELLNGFENHGCRITGDFIVKIDEKHIVFPCRNISESRECLVTGELLSHNNAYCLVSYDNESAGDYVSFRCHGIECKKKSSLLLGKTPASLLEFFNGPPENPPAKKPAKSLINEAPEDLPLREIAPSVLTYTCIHWHDITKRVFKKLLVSYCMFYPGPSALDRLLKILKKYQYRVPFQKIPALKDKSQNYRDAKMDACDISDCKEDLNSIVELVNRKIKKEGVSDEKTLFPNIKITRPFVYNIETSDLKKLLDCFSSFYQSEEDAKMLLMALKKFGYRSFFDTCALFTHMNQEQRNSAWDACDVSFTCWTLEDIIQKVNALLTPDWGSENIRFRKVERIALADTPEEVHHKYTKLNVEVHHLTKEILQMVSERIVVIESGMGTGKTTAIIALAKALGLHIISVCCRVTQVNEHVKIFRQAGLKTRSYKERDSMDFFDIGEESFVTTVDSIHKVRKILGDNQTYAGKYILLLDELHSLTDHLTMSETMTKCRKRANYDIQWLINHTHRVFAMDNAIDSVDVKLLEIAMERTNDKRISFIANKWKKYEGVPAYFKQHDDMIAKIHSDIKKGRGFTVSCNTKRQAERVAQQCREFPECDVSKIKLYTQEEGVIPEDINADWSNCFVIYSPTLTTGVDFNSAKPQTVYLFIWGEDTITPATTMQMMCRNRNIRDVWICAENMRNNVDYASFDEMSKTIDVLCQDPARQDGDLSSICDLMDTCAYSDVSNYTEKLIGNPLTLLWKSVYYRNIQSRSSFVYSLQCLLEKRGFRVIPLPIQCEVKRQDKQAKTCIDIKILQNKQADVRSWKKGTCNNHLDSVLAALTGIETHEIKTHTAHLDMHKQRIFTPDATQDTTCTITETNKNRGNNIKKMVGCLFTDTYVRRIHMNLMLVLFTNQKLRALNASNNRTDFQINNYSTDEFREMIRRDLIDTFNVGLSSSLKYSDLTLKHSEYSEDEAISISDTTWKYFNFLYQRSNRSRPASRRELMDCIFRLSRTLYGTRFTDKKESRSREDGRKQHYNYETSTDALACFVHTTDWSYFSLRDIDPELVQKYGLEMRQERDVRARLENDRQMGLRTAVSAKKSGRQACFAFLRGCCKMGDDCSYEHKLGMEGTDIRAGPPTQREKLLQSLAQLYRLDVTLHSKPYIEIVT